VRAGLTGLGLTWRVGLRTEISRAYVSGPTGREMAWHKSDLDSDRLELPVSSWWITCITILALVLAVLSALA
jgi:hypothetical protein